VSGACRKHDLNNGDDLSLHKHENICLKRRSKKDDILPGMPNLIDVVSLVLHKPQDESISMNIKLRNLRSAEEDLGKFLGNIVVSSELATSICGDEVNDAYLEYVIELNNKVSAVLTCFGQVKYGEHTPFTVFYMQDTVLVKCLLMMNSWPKQLQRARSVCLTQIKYIGQTQPASDGSSLDMPPSTTMAAKGVHPHLENLKTKVRGS